MATALSCIVCYDGVPVGTVELEFFSFDERLGEGHIVTSAPRHPAVARVRALCVGVFAGTDLPKIDLSPVNPASLVPHLPPAGRRAIYEQVRDIASHFSLQDELGRPLPTVDIYLSAVPLAAGVTLMARFSDARALVPAKVVVPPRTDSAYGVPAA